MRRAVRGAALAALASWGLGGCAPALRTELVPEQSERPLSLSKLAVAPFAAGVRVAAQDGSAASGPALLSRQVAEAVAARGVPVVAPEDMERALGALEERRGPVFAQAAARVAWEQFGANAVLVGEVNRYQDRRGEALGAAQPAGVGFEVTLYRAPDGARLWRAVFDETQAPLTENLFNAARYPGGGTRWLTAEELARWGAREVARELPGGR